MPDMSVQPAEALLEACTTIESQPAVVTDDQASEFFDKFPLQNFIEFFTLPNIESADTQLAIRALSKLLPTNSGRAVLLRSAPVLAAAARAPALPALRRLAAEQLGALLLQLLQPATSATAASAISQDEAAAGGTLTRDSVAAELVTLLQDVDTGVASEASKALERAAGADNDAWLGQQLLDGGTDLGCQLAALASGLSSSVVRLRAMSLLVKVGTRGAGSLEALGTSGVLAPVLAELENVSDPLACLGALQVITELAEQAGVGAALCGLVLPHLSVLRARDVAGSATWSGAMNVAALLVGAAAAVDPSAAPGGAADLLAEVRRSLDDRGDVDATVEGQALDALERLGAVSKGGAELVLRDAELTALLVEKALGRAPSSDVRLRALHTVASLAGVERAGKAQQRDAALLSTQAEDHLRVAVFSVATSSRRGGATPAEAVWELLQQPFQDLHIATYRFLGALSLRPWCAAELLRHPQLTAHLADPSSEVGATASHWRFAVVSAAASAARSAASDLQVEGAVRAELSAALPQLQRAVAAGPYGGGNVGVTANGRGVPQVATLH